MQISAQSGLIFLKLYHGKIVFLRLEIWRGERMGNQACPAPSAIPPPARGCVWASHLIMGGSSLEELLLAVWERQHCHLVFLCMAWQSRVLGLGLGQQGWNSALYQLGYHIAVTCICGIGKVLLKFTPIYHPHLISHGYHHSWHKWMNFSQTQHYSFFPIWKFWGSHFSYFEQVKLLWASVSYVEVWGLNEKHLTWYLT